MEGIDVESFMLISETDADISMSVNSSALSKYLTWDKEESNIYSVIDSGIKIKRIGILKLTLNYNDTSKIFIIFLLSIVRILCVPILARSIWLMRALITHLLTVIPIFS